MASRLVVPELCRRSLPAEALTPNAVGTGTPGALLRHRSSHGCRAIGQSTPRSLTRLRATTSACTAVAAARGLGLSQARNLRSRSLPCSGHNSRRQRICASAGFARSSAHGPAHRQLHEAAVGATTAAKERLRASLAEVVEALRPPQRLANTWQHSRAVSFWALGVSALLVLVGVALILAAFAVAQHADCEEVRKPASSRKGHAILMSTLMFFAGGFLGLEHPAKRIMLRLV